MKAEQKSLQGVELAVIGGTSNIAMQTIELALNRGATVTALVRNTESPDAIVLAGKGVRLVEGSVTDPVAVDRVVFESQPKATINFAARFDQSRYSQAAYDVNVEGERNVLAATKKVGADHILINTTGTRMKGRNAYKDTKLAARRLVEESGVPYVDLEFASVVNTRDRNDIWNKPYYVVDTGFQVGLGGGRRITVPGLRLGLGKIPSEPDTPFSYLSALTASRAVLAALDVEPYQTIPVVDGVTTTEWFMNVMKELNGLHGTVVLGKELLESLYVGEAIAEFFGKHFPITPGTADFILHPPMHELGTPEEMTAKLGIEPIPFEQVVKQMIFEREAA